MRAVPVAGFLGLFLFSTVGAQPAVAQEVPKAEISGGYEPLHLWGNGGSETLDKGWYADIAGNVSRSVGIVFQASGSYKTVHATIANEGVVFGTTGHLRATQFLGGVRLNARPSDKVIPFVQGLLGAFHTSGEGSTTATFEGQSSTVFSGSVISVTDMALQVGGGINVMVTKRLGIRAGTDYIRIFHENAGLNATRFGFGAVVAF